MSTVTDDYELALWDNSFYSSAAAITQLSSSNHIYNLRKTVNIPNSELSQLIAAGLLESPSGDAGTSAAKKKTLLMKVSPSMRALESALNSDAPARSAPEVILEENESPDTLVVDGSTRVHSASQDAGLAKGSVHSRFTAESDETIRANSDEQSTMDKAQIKPLPLPKTENGAQLQHRMSGAAEKSPPVPRKEVNVAQQNLNRLEAPFEPKPASRPVKSMLDAAEASPQKPARKEPNALSRGISSSSAGAYSSKSSSVFGTPKSSARASEQIPPSSPAPISKRSATSGDIPKLARNASSSAQSTTSNSKRFSFRGLFKLKSKNHSLNNIKEEKPSQPKKISAKSPSTPNFKELARPESSKDTKPGPAENFKGMFRRRKSQSSMDFLSEDLPKTMTKSATDMALSLRSKPLPNIQNEQADDQSKSRTLPKLPEPKKATTTAKESPQLSDYVPYMDTPVTAVLSRESNTIREVDDSDYLLGVHEIQPELKSETWEPQTPVADVTDEVSQDLHNLSLMKDSEDIFGSPFLVPIPNQDSRRFSLPKPLSDLVSELDSRSRLNSNRASLPVKEQLVGEALFPKSLNPHEVESIVSLERSISMRSLRSNGKRSSYLNYNGSDENILLGSEVGVVRLGLMKRSGSILKNSLSSKSLRAEVLSLIDAALEGNTTEEQAVYSEQGQDGTTNNSTTIEHETNNGKVATSAASTTSSQDNYSELIEFSDFIDFDNLDFSATHDFLDEDQYNAASPEPLQVPSYPASADQIEIYVEDELVMDQADAESHTTSPNPLQRKTFQKQSEPEIIAISSGTDHDELSPLPDLAGNTAPETLATDDFNQSYDYSYGIGIQDSQQRESPSLAARPFSMSFKGFNGSLGKSKVMRKHGLHQLLQFSNVSSEESSVVGQGFGSSDEEFSEDERETTDDFTNSYNLSPNESRDSLQANQEQRQKASSTSAERRKQHLKNVLQLQPPSQSMPFRHDRIPSISDQSAASSPRLLTSFIGRLRKPPSPAAPQPTVRFSSRIILYDTYHPDEYDRHPDVATCNQLTPLLAQQIKLELNEFKAEMTIHASSRENTHFF